MKFTVTQLHRINLSDRTFDTGYKKDCSSLEVSISRFGIISPVILLDLFENQYRIITGFSRIRAAQKLMLLDIPAIILSSYDRSEKEYFMINLEHNYPYRKYNPVEKGIILHKASMKFKFNDDEIIEQIFPLIDLSNGQFDLKRYIEIDSYKENLKDLLASGTITLETAGILNDLKSEDTETILNIFESFKPSASNQRVILETIDDIIKRDKCSIIELLDAIDLKSILDNKRMTSSQKCFKFMEKLKMRKFPIYCKAENRFKDLKKQLDLPSKVSIEHSPYFESPGIELKMKISNQRESKKILDKLSEILFKQEFSDLFTINDLLMGDVEE